MSVRRPNGFTLIELLVAMGILAGFLVMLVQLVDSGLQMFRDGEVGQALADRGGRAQRVLRRELSMLRGAAAGRDRQRADDRLVVQLLPIGLPAQAERDGTVVQVLRAAVRLPPDRELQVVDKKLLADILRESPELADEQLAAELERRRAAEPLRGIGNLLLLPWRQEGADDATLELRAGWFVPGQTIPAGPDRFVDPFAVPVPGSGDLPSLVVHEITAPILQDLLHVEFALWGQRTTSWGDDDGPLRDVTRAAQPGAEPQPIWDSARGGWLDHRLNGGEWAYDVGPWSEHDVRDDIHPHAILVRCVVAQPADFAPEGLTARALGPDDTVLALYSGDAFPGDPDGGWVKLDGEWLRYAARDGDELRGLRRGQRGTKAIDHEAGTRVHVGRLVEFVVPILHAKDDWNG